MKNQITTLLLFLSGVLLAVDKPNVLWLTIEDTSPQYIGCYGNKSAITPAIDSLAANGVRFANAYSTGTACSPSRACIITGVRSSATGNGHHRSAFPLSDAIHGFPSYLKAAGYYTSNNYKTDYNTSDAQRLIDESWHECSGQAHWRKRSGDQAFFSVFNFSDSHQSRTMTEPYEWYLQTVYNKLPNNYKVSDEDVFVPPFYRDSREMRKHMARMQNAINITDKQIGERLAQLESDGLMDETIIFFYADHGEGMPRAKGNGIAQGYKVPMVIYFPEKYEHLNPWGKGAVVDELVSFEDLAPTMLSLAGLDIPDYYRGKAILGSKRTTSEYAYGARDRIEASQDFARAIMKDSFIYVRNFMTDRPEYNFMKYYDISEISKAIRHDYWDGKLNPDQALMMNPTRTQECLYNLKADPYELNNLAYDVAYSHLKAELSSQLKKEMKEVREVHLFPEYHLDLLTTPYDDRMNDSLLPIDKVLDMAWLSGSDSSVISEQIEGLKSLNDVVRYWACIGLRAQADEQLKRYENVLTAAIHDSYAPVQIEAAYICYRVFNDEDAKTILSNYAVDSNTFLANAAMSNIANLKEDGLAFLNTINQVAAKGHYGEQNLAQTYLHYYDKKELYWGEGNDYYWMPYSSYSFDSNTADVKGNNDLEGSSLFINNDELRGKILAPDVLKTDSALHFKDNFFLPKNYTVSFWLKRDEVSSSKTLLKLNSASNELDISVNLDKDGTLQLVVNQAEQVDAQHLETGKWYHLQLSHWGDEYVLYLNGLESIALTEKNSADIIEGALIASPALGIDALNIYHFPMTDARAYGKYTNELVIAENTLRDAPVHWYAMNGDFTDKQGNRDLSANANSTFEAKGERDLAFKMTGNETGVIMEDDYSLSHSFSLSFLLNASATTQWATPLSLGDASTFMYICPYTSWEEGLYYVVDNSLSRHFYLADNKTFPSNIWQHITLTYAQGNWKSYIEGQLSSDINHEVDIDNMTRLVIGGLPHKAGGYFTGYIDELKIYDYALVPSEVLQDKVQSYSSNAVLGDHKIQDVHCYPNPAIDHLNIVGNKHIDLLQMYDMTGRQVLTAKFNAKTGSINLGNLNNGLYVLSCLGRDVKEELFVEIIN